MKLREILIDFANQEQVLLYDGSDQVTKEEAFLLYDVITQRRQELRAKIERNQNKREERRRLERRLKHRKNSSVIKKPRTKRRGGLLHMNPDGMLTTQAHETFQSFNIKNLTALDPESGIATPNAQLFLRNARKTAQTKTRELLAKARQRQIARDRQTKRMF